MVPPLDIRNEVRLGVVEGMQSILSDEKLMEEFWRKGYDQLVLHGGNNANQWVGKRILTWLITSIVIAGVVWLLRNGALKG